jgi:hypothetical protein
MYALHHESRCGPRAHVANASEGRNQAKALPEELTALLDAIRAPSHADVVRTIKAAGGDGLSEADIARIADAVLELWGRA